MAAKGICSIQSCCNPAAFRGWCRAHYEKWRRHGDPEGGLPIRTTAIGEAGRWVEAHVGHSGEECLEWPYGRTPQGYGRVFWRGRNMRAHQMMCELAHGPAPKRKKDVAHSCGKGHLGCVNPRHLRWATRSENGQDAAHHGVHPLYRLTPGTARQIRALRGSMRAEDLALQFGLHVRTIYKVWRGESWAWAKDRQPMSNDVHEVVSGILRDAFAAVDRGEDVSYEKTAYAVLEAAGVPWDKPARTIEREWPEPEGTTFSG